MTSFPSGGPRDLSSAPPGLLPADDRAGLVASGLLSDLSLPFGLRLRDGAVLCAAFTAALSALVLVGWILHVEILRQLLPGLPPMKANAAICSLLACCSLVVYSRSAPGSRSRRAAAVGPVVVGLVSAATLAEYASGGGSGSISCCFRDGVLADAPYPGRPSVNAALGFGLLGVALLCWEVRLGRWSATNVLAWLAASLGVIAVIGYTTGAQSLINLSGRQHIALSAAVALAVLSLGVLLAHSVRPELTLGAGGGPGAIVLRRLLPLAIALPVALASLTVAGHQLGLFSKDVGELLFATALTATLPLLGWVIASAVNRADAQRSQVERMMRAIAETASDAIVSVDAAGLITYANPALASMFGYQIEDIIGFSATTLFPGGDHEGQRRRLADLLGSGDPNAIGHVAELSAVRSDGREFPIEVSRGVWEVDGERVATGIIRDVSERHRAEQRLRGLLESAPDAIIVVNHDGEIVVANARAEAVFGYSRDELIGSSIELLVPDRKRQAHAAFREEYAVDPRPRYGNRPGDFRARRKDGSEFPAEITLNPVHTDDGLLVASAIRDVTERRRAEQATARLAAIVEASPDAIIGLTLDATIDSWNAGAEQLYGYTHGEAIGQPITILNLPEQRDSRERVDAALTGQTVKFETVDLARDGARVEVGVTLSPIRDRTGAIIGVSCLAQDMSERKRAERELARLADAAEHATDLDGRVRHWNHGAETIYGFSAKEAIGQDLRQLTMLSDEPSNNIARVLTGESRYQYETQRRRKDGTIIDVLLTIASWQVDGQVVGVTGVTIDISERKRTEQASAQLAAIVESSDDAIIAKTLEGQITSWNQAAQRIYGYSPAEAVGRQISMLIPSGQQDDTSGLLASIASGGGVSHHESSRRRKDGRAIDVSVTVSPIRDPNGRVIGASTVARDITEHKHAERELARLADAAEYGSDAVVSIDSDTRVRAWNPGAERLFGFTADEALGHSLCELTAFTDEPREQLARMLAGEPAYQYETRRRRKDGTMIDVLLTISPWQVDGQMIGVTGIAIDLTERKRVERAREQALADLHEAQRIAKVGSSTWDPVSEEGSWSAQMYEIFGRDPIDGPATREALLAYVHPDDRERVAAEYAHAVAGGAGLEFDYRIVAGDHAQRVLHARGHADPARPGCYMDTVQDVTDQRESEARLRRSEQQLRTIFEGSPIGVALVDAHVPFTLLQANTALGEMLGIDPAQLVGRSALTLIDKHQRAVAQSQLARLLDSEDRRLMAEVQIREAHPEPLWVNVTAAVISDAAGHPEQLVLQLQDITERKQHEHELRFYAERDPLTGLLNRRRLEEELERAVAENTRYVTPATLMVCDLDNLKLVNDTLGHKAGDELIKGIACALRDRLRDTDVFARMGGDEFAVLLPHTELGGWCQTRVRANSPISG